jgi:hypothetical protein
MAKIGNEAKLVLKLAEERIRKANGGDERLIAGKPDNEGVQRVKARIHGRDEALATLKSIHLELMEE